MTWLNQAQLLLRKAEQDAVVVSRAVTDSEISDEIAGFHTQQAAEKAMKAVLSVRGIAYRRTHDLQELFDLLSDNGVVMPPEVDEVVGWSPYAVIYRYEDWPSSSPVDRERANQLALVVILWCRALVPTTT